MNRLASNNPKIFASIQTWYLVLSKNDQLAIKVLVAFLIVISIVFMILLPSFRYRDSAVLRLNAESELLHWMKSSGLTIQSKSTVPADSNGVSLLSMINDSAKKNNMAFQQYEPLQNGVVRISLANVNFNDLMVWLNELQLLQSVKLIQLSIEGRQNNGFVDARIEMK